MYSALEKDENGNFKEINPFLDEAEQYRKKKNGSSNDENDGIDEREKEMPYPSVITEEPEREVPEEDLDFEI